MGMLACWSKEATEITRLLVTHQLGLRLAASAVGICIVVDAIEADFTITVAGWALFAPAQNTS